MKSNQECFYCVKDERLRALMIEIAQMEVSTLYLLKDQSHLGRCVLALNEHKRELFEIEESVQNKFMNDVYKVAQAISNAFKADKINYAIYGDIVSHVHFHLVPKYINAKNWGEPFENIPENIEVKTDEEYEEIINTLKKCL